MRLKIVYQTMFLFAAGWMISCQNNTQETDNTPTMDNINPFFTEFPTPFGLPLFDAIRAEHYLPAFKEGFARQIEEVEFIVNNPALPDFNNTIEALEQSGLLLNNVSSVFYNLNSAHTNDELQQIAQEVAPLMSEHGDNIYLNKALFERVKAVWDQRENLTLNTEQSRLLEVTYKSFVRGGALLKDDQQADLREMNKELSSLTVQFGQHMLSETNGFKLIIEDKKDLSGLPDEIIAAAASEATSSGHEGKWVFGLSNPSVMPFLQYADNRDLRKKIWEAYSLRGNQKNEQNNQEILVTIANLRNRKARLLGYETHAHYVLEESMAAHPQKVNTLLEKLWQPALKMARNDAKVLEDMLRKKYPREKLQPWDWRYYEEKLRAEKYSLDENQLKPYFALENVRDGIFYTVNRLFGLSFEQLDQVPVYHPDVVAYEVKRLNKHVGVLYMDFHPRESKRGGAWMTSFRKQSNVFGNYVTPVISIVCNFTKPGENTPALLTWDEVTTFFHEFGHAIHGLLSDVTYRSLSGTSVPRDFVELPSQILECWAAEPEVLQVYAKHYKTGEVIPEELIEKMTKASHFGQGFATVEYLAASFLDMDYHTQTNDIAIDGNEFERRSMQKIGLINEIIPRYRSTYFAHIFSGGYSAGYYSYIWSALLDADAFAYFKENGIFNETTAQSFYEHILSKGGTEDPAVLYKKFRGRDPEETPLLKRRGLI